MEGKDKPLYKVLIIVSILATLAMFVTLIPWQGASWKNVLGFRSLCTFTPASTLFCALTAGVSCFLRASLVKETEGTAGEKLKKHLKALVPVLLILVLALASTVWYVKVDSRYPDGTASATFE